MDIEESILEIAISMVVMILEELKSRYNLTDVDVFKYIDSKGTGYLFENTATMFCLKDESLNTCIDLVDGKITLDDIWD